MTDPNWHATNGDPQSANHRYENHLNGTPYQVGKGKGSWFKCFTIPDVSCDFPA